ncbi:MAG: DedA family protein [Myxococcales bacterium]
MLLRERPGTFGRWSNRGHQVAPQALHGPHREPRLHKELYHFLLQFHGVAGYVGVFSVLIACGLGLPLPEDVALITGGYLAGKGPPIGVGSVWGMIFVGLAGILIGDSIIFRAGATYGEALLNTRLGRHIPGEKVARIIGLFDRHGAKFIMVARFLPGVRAVTYFVAGTTGVPYWKFLVFDGLAACASAPGWVLLGHWAGKHRMLNKAWHWAKQVQLGILVVVLAAIVLWFVFAYIRKRMRKPAPASLSALPGGRVASEPPPLKRTTEA